MITAVTTIINIPATLGNCQQNFAKFFDFFLNLYILLMYTSEVRITRVNIFDLDYFIRPKMSVGNHKGNHKSQWRLNPDYQIPIHFLDHND